MKVVCSEPYVQCTKEANVLIYLLTTLLWAHTLSYISLIQIDAQFTASPTHKNLIHLKGD